MDRLVNYLKRYRPQVDPQALLFLRRKSIVHEFAKDTILKNPYQPLDYFCIVLEGMVGGLEITPHSEPTSKEGHQLNLRELIMVMNYFSGPAHIFASRNQTIEYRALTQTTILKIPLSQAQYGQLHFPDLAELFQIMKQRKINQLRCQVTLYQEKDYYRRYYLYRKLLPECPYLLSRDIQCLILQMSKTHFHRVKAFYLQNHKNKSDTDAFCPKLWD